MLTVIDKKILENLHPLSLVDEQYSNLLCASCDIKIYSNNDVIIRKPFTNNMFHYLLDGCVEVRKSFENRFVLDLSSENIHYPLEEQLSDSGVVKAKEDCRILSVSADSVDRLLTLSQSQSESYKEPKSEEADFAIPTSMIVDDFGSDWTGSFLQSRLASHLPSAVLHELFTSLVDVNVCKDDIIIKKNTPGDYFYIIKAGTAQIITDSRGPYHGESFYLSEGGFFGDEALIADTIRNATVRMTTDGVLGQLDVEAFNNIIRNNLVLPINSDTTNDGHNYQYIDVRLPIEFNHSHHNGAENIPISHLRKRLDDFNNDETYIVTAEGGRRSELAAYLLRQAGINSYYMSN